MTEHRTNICIGGPLDGKRYYAGEASHFRVPVRPTLRLAEIEEARHVPSPVLTEEARYVLTWFNTPEGRVSFWTIDGTTPLEAMQLLVDGYRQATTKREPFCLRPSRCAAFGQCDLAPPAKTNDNECYRRRMVALHELHWY